MKYCVLLPETDEPAKAVPCTIDDVLPMCYELIGCRTVQLIPIYEHRIKPGYDLLTDEDIPEGKTVCINPLASWIFGADIHGSGILGNAVILKLERNEEDEESMDLAFMTEEEANAMAEELNKDYDDKYDQVVFKVLTSMMKD